MTARAASVSLPLRILAQYTAGERGTSDLALEHFGADTAETRAKVRDLIQQAQQQAARG